MVRGRLLDCDGDAADDKAADEDKDDEDKKDKYVLVGTPEGLGGEKASAEGPVRPFWLWFGGRRQEKEEEEKVGNTIQTGLVRRGTTHDIHSRNNIHITVQKEQNSDCIVEFGKPGCCAEGDSAIC